MKLTFDRGTLVLRGRDLNTSMIEGLGFIWDFRVEAWRVAAARYAEVARRLGPGLDDLVRSSAGACPEIGPAPLRTYQKDALGAWEIAGRRGVVVLPTGAGKTHVALSAIARVGRPALVLVPTLVLLEQWMGRLVQALGEGRHPAAAKEPSPIGALGGGRREVRPITVATFESGWRHLDRFGNMFDLLVVDEVHHFESGLRAEALEMCTAPCRLGLTATPPDREEGRARLEALVGPVIFELRVADLAGRALSPLDRSVVRVLLDPDEASAYAAAWGPFSEATRTFFRGARHASWPEFFMALRASPGGEQVLKGYFDARRIVDGARAKGRLVAELLRNERGRPTLIFTAGNQSAYDLSRSLFVPAITCHVPAAERERILERFRDGTYRAIISARVLNEGVDVPEAELAIVAGGAHGAREHVQRVGRVLRPRPGKCARLIEIIVAGTHEERQSRKRRRGLAA